ncbi:hypothetical protein TW80_01655 [Loktanella sp. S4079]|nr:hypothetical protein TW80_01655 [Loktanella sp. S4079]
MGYSNRRANNAYDHQAHHGAAYRTPARQRKAVIRVFSCSRMRLKRHKISNHLPAAHLFATQPAMSNMMTKTMTKMTTAQAGECLAWAHRS